MVKFGHPRGTSFWRSGAVTAVITALICVSLTTFVFYYYLEKESEIISQTRKKLRAAQDANRKLVNDVQRLNASVSSIILDIDNVAGTVAHAHVALSKASVKEGDVSSQKSLQKFEGEIENLVKENHELKAQLELSNGQLKSAQNAHPKDAAPQAAVAVAGGSGGAGGKRWLTIGIPTVPRKGNPRYLVHTVDKIIEQLPLREDDPLYMKVMVVVFNNKPGTHQVFDEVRKRVEASPHAGYFHFVEKGIQETDSIHNPENNANVPNTKVRKQTRAVVALMRESRGRAGHFLFMEDDFIMCPHAIRAMSYITSKAHAYRPGGWSGIRISYGLCGIIINDSDVEELANYLEQHQGRRPPDHLLPEWIAAEKPQAQKYLQGRRNLGYRFNIIEHIGSVSSLRDAPQVGWPGCYAELIFPIVFEGEAWNPKQCAHDDLWPCDTRPKDWPLDFALWHSGKKEGESVTLRTDSRSGLGAK